MASRRLLIPEGLRQELYGATLHRYTRASAARWTPGSELSRASDSSALATSSPRATAYLKPKMRAFGLFDDRRPSTSSCTAAKTLGDDAICSTSSSLASYEGSIALAINARCADGGAVCIRRRTSSTGLPSTRPRSSKTSVFASASASAGNCWVSRTYTSRSVEKLDRTRFSSASCTSFLDMIASTVLGQK